MLRKWVVDTACETSEEHVRKRARCVIEMAGSAFTHVLNSPALLPAPVWSHVLCFYEALLRVRSYAGPFECRQSNVHGWPDFVNYPWHASEHECEKHHIFCRADYQPKYYTHQYRSVKNGSSYELMPRKDGQRGAYPKPVARHMNYIRVWFTLKWLCE